MRICILAPAYYPAHKAGGPVPGIMGIVEGLAGHEVHVVTSDRDLGDTVPYPEPHRGSVRVGGALVHYLPPPGRGSAGAWWTALRLARSSDVVHLNSLMSKTHTIVPLLFLALSGYRGRVALSPRGELASSALVLGGSGQKRAWLGVLRRSGWWRRIGRAAVTWVVSSEHEADDVRRAFPAARVAVAPERLRGVAPVAEGALPATRPPLGEGLRVVSVGRVAPVKGTEQLVRGLAGVRRPVTLRLVGLVEDPAYAARVEAAAAQLPDHARVDVVGALPPEEVERELAQAHLFALLTRGENFGHAIGEALRSGCPVLVTDRTPWSGVAAPDAGGAGEVLTVEESDDAAVVAGRLDAWAALDDETLARRSAAARAFVADLEQPPSLVELLD